MSLLRQLVNEESLKKDPGPALLAAALRVRRAGLEHLVSEAGDAEVSALEEAGAVLERERALLLAKAITDPGFAPFDGPEDVLAKTRAKVKRLALELAKEGG